MIVTHNMQQAARVSQNTAFFHLGKLIEYDDTERIFTNPKTIHDPGLHHWSLRVSSTSMATDHIVKSYDQQITLLTRKILEMGGVVEQQIAGAIEALVNRNIEQAERVVEQDDQIDRMEEEIDQYAIRLLATRQPMAIDLRLIVMAMKISNDLERIGDYATNIAKRSMRLAKEPPVKPLYAIPRMAQISQAMVKEILDAYVERDADKAVAVWHRDDEVDDMFTSLFRELLTYMMEDATQHLALHRFDVRGQESGADRGPHHQYCGKDPLHDPRPAHQPDARHGQRWLEMTPRILIVEDEASLQELLAYNLERAGFAVEQAYDADEARTMIAEQAPDLVLLDWMLPYMSGLELCRQLRRQPATANLPIVMLTARVEERDRLHGLDTGADDYITKPFSVDELIARVRAVLRRIRPAFASEVLRFADLTMDLAGHRVARNGRDVHLSPTEFRLLRQLLESPGRVFSRSQLLDLVWGRDQDVELRTVDATIRRLRRALNAGGEADLLRTVRATGYALDHPVSAERVAAGLTRGSGNHPGWRRSDGATPVARPGTCAALRPATERGRPPALLLAREELQHGRVELVGLLPHREVAGILHDHELGPGNQLRHLRGVRGLDRLVVVAIEDHRRHGDRAQLVLGVVRLGRPHLGDLRDEGVELAGASATGGRSPRRRARCRR